MVCHQHSQDTLPFAQDSENKLELVGIPLDMDTKCKIRKCGQSARFNASDAAACDHPLEDRIVLIASFDPEVYMPISILAAQSGNQPDQKMVVLSLLFMRERIYKQSKASKRIDVVPMFE